MTDEGWLDRSRLRWAVVAVAAAALAARLYALGARVMHWDEGRVAYWALRYHESGQYHYRPITHGPFLPIVNDYVFAVLGPTDFSARLAVAVVGGLLPLAAWLLRDRLRDAEVVALAVALAASPLLVYYSRFMRNDVLVAAFAFVALALAVRGLDAGDLRYGYAAAAALGLAFTTKENAVLYVLCFLGAGALLVDHRLVAAARDGRDPRGTVREWIGRLDAGLRAWAGTRRRGLVLGLGHALGATATFFAVVVFFYAPRPELWETLANPAALPGLVDTATVGSWDRFYETWASGNHQSHPYLPYLYDYLETLLYGAPAVPVFAAVGFLVDGYGDRQRDLVAFAAYWGVVSVLGYPIATDIRAPWAVVHAVVPLAIPAAVGVVYVVARGRESLAREDVTTTAIVALLVLVAISGVAGANARYANSATAADGEILQWAQPGNELKSTLADIRLVARHNDGVDVLFVGTCPGGSCGDSPPKFHVSDEASARQPPPGGPNWHSRLPLPWYLERYGAEVTSTPPEEQDLSADPPPVIVADSRNRSTVARQVDGYTAHRHAFRLWGEHIVVFVEEAALADARGAG